MHPGRCKTSNGLLFALWASTNNFAICPSCRARAVKDGGCNHMTCPQCKYVYCWICKKDLRKDHYDHFKVDIKPFGCGPALYNDSFFVIFLTLAIRHYTVPFVWWKIFIRDTVKEVCQQCEQEYPENFETIFLFYQIFLIGIVTLLVTLVYLVTVVPCVEVYILYNNIYILMRKYLICCC